MKKILTYLAAAAMSVAACSTKENAFVPDNLYTVTARMGEASEVRVAISDTGSPSWQEGDAIALYNGTAFVRFTLTDAASGTFSGPVGVSEACSEGKFPVAASCRASSRSPTSRRLTAG